MRFFWKGDQLYTKRGILPEDSIHEKVSENAGNPWTTFFLPLREPTDLVDLADFTKFLTKSIAFTANLRKIEVFVDDERVTFIHKRSADARPLDFDKRKYHLSSTQDIFKLESLSLKTLQLDVQATLPPQQPQEISTLKSTLASFFLKKKPEPPSTLAPRKIESTIFMRIAVGSASVKATPKLVRDMERTTKKSPPKTITIQILWNNFDEYESSRGAEQDNMLLEDLVPFLNQGHIYIGFQTHQTTGCAMHLATHLIPTVERESIDFVDEALNLWNTEVLVVSGIVARICYEDEMTQVNRLFTSLAGAMDDQSQTYFSKRSAHALKSFFFDVSTPHPLVSRILNTYYFKCSDIGLSILTSKGILPILSARLPDASLQKFIKNVAIVDPVSLEQCSVLFGLLKQQNWVREITMDDILSELSRRLDHDEFLAFLQWYITSHKKPPIGHEFRYRIFQMVKIPDTELRLADVKTYASPKVIPPDMPLPKDCLPVAYTRLLSEDDIRACFSEKLAELSVPSWLGFLLSTEASFSNKLSAEKKDNAFIEKVLGVISRSFGHLKEEERVMIVSSLVGVECIPTKHGLLRPELTYFKSVTLFEDLPVVEFASKGVSVDFLKALGVREHVDLQLVFGRLDELDWDHVHLVKYLSHVAQKLTEAEWAKLRAAPLFPKEEPKESKATQGEDSLLVESVGKSSPTTKTTKKVQKFKASELYFPNDLLRDLHFPILAWKGKVRPYTDEGTL